MTYDKEQYLSTIEQEQIKSNQIKFVVRQIHREKEKKTNTVINKKVNLNIEYRLRNTEKLKSL